MRGRFNREPKRPRKLLVSKRELSRLISAVQRAGVTLVPLSLYFSDRGLAKAEIGLARGKKQYDKRATSKQRDWDRQKAQLLRAKVLLRSGCARFGSRAGCCRHSKAP